MIDTKSLQFGTIAEFETPCRSMDLKGKDIVVATPDRSAGGAESWMLAVPPHCVRLALQELKCFEVVEHQFRYWGLTFTNVVAIQPSNPAFLTASGTTILMGAPKSGQIEVSFKYPVRFVSGLVTSSRRTVLSACDADGIQIAQDEMPGPNLVGSSSPIDPSTELCVKAPNISKVTFYAFDGQLVVHDLIFGF